MKREANGTAMPCPVPVAGRDLVDDMAVDYSDAFALSVPAGDRRSAECWAQAMFTPSGRLLNTFATAWGFATAVEPPRQGKRARLFLVVTPSREATVWIADGPRYRIHLAVLAGQGRVIFATFVKAHSTIWRHVLKGMMVAHRRVAPRLLERAEARTRPLR